MANTDNQPINQIISTQHNQKVLVNQCPIKQNIVDSNNNSSIIKLVPIRVVGSKSGDHFPVKTIHDAPSGSLLFSKDFKLTKVKFVKNSFNKAASPITVKPPLVNHTVTSRFTSPNLDSITPAPPSTVVSHHVTPGSVSNQSSTSVFSVKANRITSTTVGTFSVPGTPVYTNSSASVKSNQRNTINTGARMLCQFFKQLLESAKILSDDWENQLKNSIQNLVDKKINSEEFCNKLEIILPVARQLPMLEFINKNILPFRKSLFYRHLTLEGIKAPPVSVFAERHSLLTSNKLVLVKTPNGRSIPVIVSRLPVENVNPIVDVFKIDETMPSWIPSVPPPNNLMFPTRSSVLADTTQEKIEPTLSTLTKTKANVELKSTPVSVEKSKKQSSVSIRKSSEVKSNVIIEQSSSTPFNKSCGQIPAAFNASELSLPIMDTDISTLSITPGYNGTKLLVPSSMDQNFPNYTVTIGKIQSVDTNKSTISSLKQEKTSATSSDNFTDVIELGNVDINEESEILSSMTIKIGTEERSCEDKLFLDPSRLLEKINKILKRHELGICDKSVIALVSHATEQRLKNLVEKITVIAKHRIEFNKNDPRYEQTGDVRAQLKFLEEVDKAQRLKGEIEAWKALIKAGKHKLISKEHPKLNEMVERKRKAELEEKINVTNLTALQALGPKKKKPRLDDDVTALAPRLIKYRTKKVDKKDLMFALENDKSLHKSQFLFKALLKSDRK